MQIKTIGGLGLVVLLLSVLLIACGAPSGPSIEVGPGRP
jgi:hypothetical protein